jgi:cytoskeleton protein RodZ
VSIGQTLAAARERAGLSQDEVAAATRIRRTLVAAIENDDFGPCGGDFYARGHLRTIAAVVGADPAPLLAEFDAAHDTTGVRASEVFEAEVVGAPRRGPNWSAAMAVALVLVLGYGVAQAFSGPDRGVTDGLPSDVPASSPATSAPTSSAPTPSGGSSAVAQAPRDKVTVALRANGTSWVQVTTASGQQLFQGLLQDGQARTFTDKSRIKLVIGNAGAIVLTVNGTDVGTPGDSGQVARVQFTPQDPAAG